jgi:hypothetical protein
MVAMERDEHTFGLSRAFRNNALDSDIIQLHVDIEEDLVDQVRDVGRN